MKKTTKKEATQFPDSWDESRVQGVLAHYQTEAEEQDVEKSATETTSTTMKIPRDLVPAVRRLVASRSKTAR